VDRGVDAPEDALVFSGPRIIFRLNRGCGAGFCYPIGVDQPLLPPEFTWGVNPTSIMTKPAAWEARSAKLTAVGIWTVTVNRFVHRLFTSGATELD